MPESVGAKHYKIASDRPEGTGKPDRVPTWVLDRLVDVTILVMGGLLILCIDPTALAAIADSETPWLTFAVLLLLSTLAVGGRYAARRMRR